MTALSDEFAEAALELITEFGQDCEFNRVVRGSYDPATGTTTGDSSLTWTGKCAPENYQQIDRDLLTVTDTNTRLWVHQLEYAPVKGDSVTFGGKEFRIQEVNKEVVNGFDVLYDLRVQV